MMKFLASISRRKLPRDGTALSIALHLQRVDAPTQGGQAVQSARQTASEVLQQPVCARWHGVHGNILSQTDAP